MRATAKVLVQAIQVLLLCALLPVAALAQAITPQPAQARDATKPFAIADNSFLVEEAFNQEAGIFQHIFGFQRAGKVWNFGFTQEWPVVSQKHQFSYTLSYNGLPQGHGFGDVQFNYRYQATMEEGRTPAFSPRVSLIVPSGSTAFTDNSLGLQVNLPVSKQHGNIYLHFNGGFTWLARAEAMPGVSGSPRASLLSPHVAASAIYRVQPMFHLMLESVVNFEQTLDTAGVRPRSTVLTISPGARGGWNLGDQQLILGIAAPLVWIASDVSPGVFLYLSWELPFKK